jgi:hypothetical protein
LDVRTKGGVHDLARVVGVLALLDLTPTHLTSTKDNIGLRVAMRIEGPSRACELCASRLAVLYSVNTVELSPVAADVGGRPWTCATASH